MVTGGGGGGKRVGVGVGGMNMWLYGGMVWECGNVVVGVVVVVGLFVVVGAGRPVWIK